MVGRQPPAILLPGEWIQYGDMKSAGIYRFYLLFENKINNVIIFRTNVDIYDM
jgi:hypothetical protein